VSQYLNPIAKFLQAFDAIYTMSTIGGPGQKLFTRIFSTASLASYFVDLFKDIKAMPDAKVQVLQIQQKIIGYVQNIFGHYIYENDQKIWSNIILAVLLEVF